MSEFYIQRRYEVWVEKRVDAESFDAAVEKAKKTQLKDFLKPVSSSVELNDWTEAGGLGVIEAK